MSNRDNPFHSHGDQGTKPDDGLDFQTGGNPKAPEFDFFWFHTIQKIQEFNTEFDRLDADDDGIVDEADYANDADATTYKGNDIDSDGSGAVDTAEYANDADASTYKGNDIDSDGSGAVDEAETVSGNDGQSHFAGSLPRFADTAEGLANTSEGDLWYNNADNSVYLNDGQ